MATGLRITGGEKRGRKLFSPPKDSIRPASDMIRQAVFNMLTGELEGREFNDIFAGTGIVGIEALSRGAKRAIFVENDRRRVDLIKRNLAHVGLVREGDVRLADAFLWARHFRPSGGPTIVFLGPPYELFAAPELQRTLDLVARVQASLRPDDILVLQFAQEIPEESLPGAEGWYRLRKYGKTRVGLWSPTPKESAGSDELTESTEGSEESDDEQAGDA